MKLSKIMNCKEDSRSSNQNQLKDVELVKKEKREKKKVGRCVKETEY
jgi:hypothetical protein